MALQSPSTHHRSSSRERIAKIVRRVSIGKRHRDSDGSTDARAALGRAGLLPGAAIGWNLNAVDDQQRDGVRDMMSRMGESYWVEESQSSKTGAKPSPPSITLTTSASTHGSYEESDLLTPASLPPENVFEYDTSQGPPIEIRPKSQVVNENVMKICVFTKDGENLIMRMLLDTGSKTTNLIAHCKAIQTGYPIEDYTGERLVTANGDSFKPVGKQTFTWHFWKSGHERTYKCEFLVVPDSCPYDVIVGFKFISNAQLFNWNLDVCVLVPQKTSKEEQKKRDQREKERREQNNQLKEEERRKRRENEHKEFKEKRKS